MNNWSMNFHPPQGSASSLPDPGILTRLSQLYVVLQSYDHAWCQANPFSSLVNERSEAELCELAVIWTQWIDNLQSQLRKAAPMVNATSEQPIMDYPEPGLGINLTTEQPPQTFAWSELNDAPPTFYDPGIQNKVQEAAPQQPPVRVDHEPIGRDQAIAVLAQQPSLPQAAAPVEINTDNGTITLPVWLFLVRPEPLAGDQVIMVRRECQVVLNIKFKELSSVTTRKSLVIPSTAGVRTEDYYDEGEVVHLSVRVFGADTQNEYKSVCGACSKREGKRKGKPSLVDFYSASNVIKASKDEVAQVKFKFSCYPKHQGPNESAYLLEVVLVENPHQGQLAPSQRVVAACRLPWPFKVGKPQRGEGAPAAPAVGTVPEASGPSGQHHMTVDTPIPRACVGAEPGVPTVEPLIPSSPEPSSLSEEEPQGTPFEPGPNPSAPSARDPRATEVAGSKQRKRGPVEAGLDDGDSQNTTEGRRVRPRRGQWNGVLSTGPAGPSASAAHQSPSRPFTTAAGPAVTQGTIPHGVSPSNGSSNSPATSATPVPQPNPPPRPVQAQQSSAQPANSVLRSTNPRKGPVSGGIEIWLCVDDLPTTFTLYARFGSQVAATVVQNRDTLSCVLPSASHTGCVKVTLSHLAYHGAPEYGTSLAEFEYHGDHEPLITTLLRMEEKGRPEYTPSLRAVLIMLRGDHAPRDSNNSQAGQVEPAVVDALLSLSEKPNFDDIVSTSNDSSQTLAHLSVLYGYISLLERLVEWRIDLTVADISGLTALHCAYLKEDRKSIRILLSGGASSSIEDKLGRRPRDLLPEGSDLADLPDEEIGIREGSPPIEHPNDHEFALGEQYAVLEAEEGHGNDSGHGGSDSGSDASSNNDEDEDVMGIDSPALEPGPSNSKVSTLDIMNELLVSKKSRKKSGPRLIPDTPHDPAISTVAKKLQDAEAEPSVIDFLCNEVFPDGTISLAALKAPMTTEEITKFQVAPGAEKYRGLLVREREVLNCRLCPEDNKLEFKDPEEALHHITKDHFDMGYSCTCGCNTTYWTSRDLKKHQKGIGIEHVQATAT